MCHVFCFGPSWHAGSKTKTRNICLWAEDKQCTQLFVHSSTFIMKCHSHSCFLVGSACVNGILTGTLKTLFSQPISRMSSTIRTCRKIAKCIWTSYDFHGHLSIWSAKARHPVSYCKRTSRNDASDDYLPPISKAPPLKHRTLRVEWA